jgi:Methyltransferase domain
VKTASFLRRKPAALPEHLPVFMDAGEFSQILATFEAVAPRHCLEWGSGGSTRALLEHCPFIERYVSVEHDPRWYEEVKRRIADPRLTLTLVPPSQPMPGHAKKATKAEIIAWDLEAETNAALMRDYVAYPRTLGLQFDLVFVDGRARCFCMREGFSMLRSGGVLVLHDAQRPEYHETARALGRAVFLTPWKRGQVCLIRKP